MTANAKRILAFIINDLYVNFVVSVVLILVLYILLRCVPTCCASGKQHKKKL